MGLSLNRKRDEVVYLVISPEALDYFANTGSPLVIEVLVTKIESGKDHTKRGTLAFTAPAEVKIHRDCIPQPKETP